MEKEKKGISLLLKIFVVILLIGIAFFIFYEAPYFRPTETFPKGVMRVVVDDKDVTNSLKDEVWVEDGITMMSAQTIMQLFDTVYLFEEEQYDSIIITSQDDVVVIPMNQSTIVVNGETKEIEGQAVKKEGKIYLPISSLTFVTDVSIDYQEKVIATTPKGWSRAKVVRVSGTHALKAYPREIALHTGKAKTDELLFVFDTEGKETDEYLTVRNERGDIGYFRYGDIRIKNIEQLNQGAKYLELQTTLKNSKQTLIWEYAQNGTPNRIGQEKIDAINIISPTWLEVMNANLEIKSTIDEDYLAWAKQNGYRLWPTVKNDYISMEDLSTIMHDMHLRDSFIQTVVAIASENHFEGINLDFENMYKADKDYFSQFVREFSATLRRNGIIVSVDVTVAGGSDNYSLCYDRTAIGKAVDYVMLMAYDQYGDWSPKIGPVASLSWVKSNIEEMIQFEKVPREKIFLCVPFYSRYWVAKTGTDEKVRSTAITMEQANRYLKQYQEAAKWSEEDGQYIVEYDTTGGTSAKIWIENEEALKKKIELVNEYELAGIAIWRWGYEDGKKPWNTIQNTLER